MAVEQARTGLRAGRATAATLLGAMLVYSACGLAIELLLVGYAGYVLGESLLLFSVVLGVFLSSMGLGAHLSRRLSDPPADAFVGAGVGLAVIGGTAPLVVNVASGVDADVFSTFLVLAVLCGALLGLAVPLCARLLEGGGTLSRVLAMVLAMDYFGALVGSLALHLAVLPVAGFEGGAVVLGAATLIAAVASAVVTRRALARPRMVVVALVAGAAVLGLASRFGAAVRDWAFTRAYEEKVLYREHTPYQEILLSRGKGGLVFRLNNRVQVGEAWEHLYHEALVHPAVSLSPAQAPEVLVLGGGDGLALREIRKHPQIKRVVLVDLDPQVVALARRHPELRRWNGGSFDDPRVTVVHDDAFGYVRRVSEKFDLVFIDLPDPVSVSLSKLYSVEFYRNVRRRLRPGGLVAVQSTQAFVNRARVMWCIVRSLERAGLHTRPYVVGPGAFTLASPRPIDPKKIDILVPVEFLVTDYARAIFEIPRDLGPLPVRANRLENHVILQVGD